MVDFLREESELPEYDKAILEAKSDENESGGENFSNDEDPLYNDAVEVILAADKASASFLQRRLRVGYARAARLLDLMESRGVIGPGEGAKPREVLMRREGMGSGDDVMEG